MTQWLAPPAARRKTVCRVGLLIGAALACCVPPSAVTSGVLGLLLPGVYRTWIYACSILIGALPYVSAGAAAAAATEALADRWRMAPARVATLAFALLFPGCDCAMSSFAASLRFLPPRLAVASITWSSCCNPVALFCTAAVLGKRMLALRICGGLIAAGLSALFVSREARLPCCSGESREKRPAQRFSLAAAATLSSLCVAASLSAPVLVYFPHSFAAAAPAAAALFGSLLSPCSTADAVLAAAFFREPQAQLSFMFASQALDFRQLSLIHRTFGTAVMMRSAVAALAALLAVCTLSA